MRSHWAMEVGAAFKFSTVPSAARRAARVAALLTATVHADSEASDTGLQARPVKSTARA